MSRAVVLVASCSLLACVQTGSVGSDTGRSDDDVDASESAGVDTAASDEGTTDPHQACRDVETVDEPYPDSCTPLSSDSQCVQCVKLVCCSALLSCPSYQACACRIDCEAANGPPDVCTAACGAAGDGCDLSGCGELECAQLCPD